jgi:hypothetical protein
MPVLTRSTSCSLKTINEYADLFFEIANLARGDVKSIPSVKLNRDFYVSFNASCLVGSAVACAQMANGLRKYLETGKLDDNLHDYERKSFKEISAIIVNTYRIWVIELTKLINELNLYKMNGTRPSFITKDSEWNC